MQTLAAFGTLIGRRASYRVMGRVVHHCNLFVTVVGPSSEGAKSVADAEAFDLVHHVEADVLSACTGGVASVRARR